MNIFRQILATIVCVALLGACSGDKREVSAESGLTLSKVVSTFGYEVVETDPAKEYVALEKQDRGFYKPVTHESARIRSLKQLDGYHGPTLGNYFLSIEVYNTQEEARKRAEEYRNLSRLASETGLDENGLSKMTVRCWGYASGKRAYLLTTHAAMFSALEQRVHSVIDGIKAYEQK